MPFYGELLFSRATLTIIKLFVIKLINDTMLKYKIITNHNPYPDLNPNHDLNPNQSIMRG